jgi:hypothetical protein
MAVDLRVTLDENEVLSEIKASIGASSILDKLELDADALLDEIYFSDFLNNAISRDESEVMSDIANAGLDLVSSESVYEPERIGDVKKFFEKALLESRNVEIILLAFKNEAIKHGWELQFSKTI